MTATPIVAIRSMTQRPLESRRASHPPMTTAMPKNMKVVAREPTSLASDGYVREHRERIRRRDRGR